MFQAIASIGDGLINAAPVAMDASIALASDVGFGTRGALDALTAMTKPMENTPSIAQFLLKCPLTVA
jgi:hypothetical protein